MSLRKLLGLPEKRAKTDKARTSEPPKGFTAAKDKFDKLSAHPGLKTLTDAQQKTFAQAGTEATGLSKLGAFDEAQKVLTDAAGVAANQIVKAQTAAKDLDAAKRKISGVLDGIQLMGVPSDHVKTLRERYAKISKDAETDLVAAAKAMALLGRDIANDETVKKAKIARDSYLSDHKTVEAAGAEALKVETETPGVLKNHRILADALVKMGFAAGKLDFPEAGRYLGICNTCIVAINAEAPAIAAAIKLREEVKAKRKAIDKLVYDARLIYGLTEESKGLVAQFKSTDQGFEGAMLAKDYKIAQTYLKTLENRAKQVLELKPQIEKQEKEEAARKVQTAEIVSIRKAVHKIDTVTGDLTRAREAFDEKVDAYFAALKAEEFDKATALVSEIKSAKSDFDDAASKSKAELKLDSEGVTIWNNQCSKRYGEMLKLKAFTPEMTKAIEAAKASYAGFAKNHKSKDIAAKVEFLKTLSKDLDTVDGLKKANDEAGQQSTVNLVAYNKHRKLFVDAFAIKPNTEELQALFNTFKTNHTALWDKVIGGDTGAADLIDGVIEDAEAVIDGAADNDTSQAAAKKSAEQARDKAIPEYNRARKLAEKYKPASKKLLDVLTTAATRFNWAFKAERFVEAAIYLAGIPAAVQAIDDAAPEWKKAAAADKDKYDKREKKLIKGFRTVLAYEDVLPGLILQIDTAITLKKEADALYGQKKVGDASEKLDAFEEAISDLLKRKADHDKAVKDKKFVDDKTSILGGDLDKAIKGFALLPETQDIQARLTYCEKVVKSAVKVLDFAEARAQWVEIERLLGLWAAKKDDNNAAWTKEASEVSKRLHGVESECDIARKIKGITPDLKKIVGDYDAVSNRFWKAYRALDWALCLSLMDEFERTVKIVAASKSDFDTALILAKAKSDTATQDIEDTSPEDLKKKPAAEKIKLLEEMRGTGEELSKEQRKLQRKVYASMDYDPAFKEADEKRRDELIETLKADKEVTEARGKWGKMTDEDRLKVLLRVLNAECKVYDIPAPAVRLYRKPKGEGFFSPQTMTLNLNTHPDSGWSDYQEAVNTVVHENMHNYQAVLERRLEEGILTPNDPEFTQAQIFAANDAAGAYVSPEEPLDDDEKGTRPYMTQPVEAHAWDSGDGVAEALVSAIKPKKGTRL